MRKAVFVIAVLAGLLCTAAVGRAQTATGQITGTVTDPSGAVMAKVKVVGHQRADRPDSGSDNERRRQAT